MMDNNQSQNNIDNSNIDSDIAMSENDTNDKDVASNSKYPTSIMLFLRVFIGGYLMYLAYQLISAADSSMSMPVKYAFCTIFVIAGLGLIILSVKMMIKGQYQGGFSDVTEEEDVKEKSEN